ncbi:hypothetical protein M422DRAFT_198478 [Sphaerobolus stellatus SS14]|nr:hypothetical protein M422DRAFT_198478 [Sphaerobolus stellatus SS14]
MHSPIHFYPLAVNAKTNEPYIQLPFPHSNIIITPPRQTDADLKAIVSILNQEAVWKWFEGPPYPYETHHGQQWMESMMKESQEILQAISERDPGELATDCPVRIIREVQDNGEEIFLGDIYVAKCQYMYITDPEERKRLTEENKKKDPGNTVWQFGDFLAPSYHGKGIMTLAIKAVIEQWMVPRMGVKHISVTTFDNNIGSCRVFEKNGFLLKETIPNVRPIPEKKGGGMHGINILEWDLA